MRRVLRVAAALPFAVVAVSSAIAAPLLTTLATFNGTNGEYPVGGLIPDGAGNLYGTTRSGGSTGYGTIFRLGIASQTLASLTAFTYDNGASPDAAMISDGKGNLYGTTEGGGVSGNGTVFKFATGSNTLTTLAKFNGSNGAQPHAPVVGDAMGNLYGTTYMGGSSGRGTVYELAPGSDTPSAQVTFNLSNGGNPIAGLIADSAGNLYGTAANGGIGGGGIVFELAAGTNTFKTLASFNISNGSGPWGIIADAGGNIFGTTGGGGSNSDGTVFEIPYGSGTIVTLATFNGSNGADPECTLIADAAGNLYGTTLSGGASNDGTAFKIAAGTNILSTLVTFNSANGFNPAYGLIADAAGNLYGTTIQGGSANDGTVFEISNAGFIVPEPSITATFLLICSLAFLRKRRLQLD